MLNNNIDTKIIARLYKLSTTEVSDALDSLCIEGALLGFNSIGCAKKIAGPVFTVKYEDIKNNNNKYQMPKNYIDQVPSNYIILIDNQAKNNITTWGGLLTQAAFNYNITGVIVNGAVRDVDVINDLKYPVYSKYVYMRSGKNRVYITETKSKLNISGINIDFDDYILADCNGVIVITKNKISEVLNRAENIKITEAKILESINTGVSLEQARVKYKYDTPWVKFN